VPQARPTSTKNTWRWTKITKPWLYSFFSNIPLLPRS
jgi:hypothetical protein